MRINKNNKLLILNLLIYILFLIPVGYLDLFSENYSTLSLNTRGYLYLLFLGISIGILMGYETYHINGIKAALAMALSLIMGTAVPHHVPYDLQGNMHLFLAYSGFVIMMLMTYMNIMKAFDRKMMNVYLFIIFLSSLIYVRFGMVNTLMEVILMSFNLYANYRLYKEALNASDT